MFDAGFFGFTPREAELTDPQHRLFLECCWEALERAGYNPELFTGAIGVFGGMSKNTYFLQNLYPHRFSIPLVNTYQTEVGNEKDYLTTRVSYKCNLHGPSLSIHTACSTSLVAVVLACQSLLTYQCDLALAGGVSVRVPQQKGYLYQEGFITSPDGHTRTFDAAAQGTVFSNGVGVVALRRLEDAIADRDPIYAVIKGAALNNDGSLKVSFTAPSVDQQAEVNATRRPDRDCRPDQGVPVADRPPPILRYWLGENQRRPSGRCCRGHGVNQDHPRPVPQALAGKSTFSNA
jgi:acyl transferase domain-containing protein